ncbi:hypothetical protein EI71_00704 [Anaeroplasma bactoclasticum]|jgi:hypoxanthine-guanine phosphoribosyltransferase|uniref:Uncharacterized protein n=1 Tax=Anaeroplasma bactoclasticum TaxID=2088 RepID=A0A397S5C5_9MOLU|nr:hypothetical protein [Anaeroplasma bactoclasticum]RIA77921.1 hypothetical protein EI71_00704 [Anaeroplasma bactoclasticum]
MTSFKNSIRLKIEYSKIEEILSKILFPIHFLGVEYAYNEDTGKDDTLISIDTLSFDGEIKHIQSFDRYILFHEVCSGSIICYNKDKVKEVSDWTLFYTNIYEMIKSNIIDFGEIYEYITNCNEEELKHSNNTEELVNIYKWLLKSLRRHQKKELNTKYTAIALDSSYLRGCYLDYQKYWSKDPRICVRGYKTLKEAKSFIKNDSHKQFAILTKDKVLLELPPVKYVLFWSYYPDFIEYTNFKDYKNGFYNDVLYNEAKSLKEAREIRKRKKDGIYKYTCIMRISDGKIYLR